tara:strand:+ start:249 stop:674 length:426 start_codon:yes stop_codon:yes gene_type:complete
MHQGERCSQEQDEKKSASHNVRDLLIVDETRDGSFGKSTIAFKSTNQSRGTMKAYRVAGQAPFGSMRQKFSLDIVASSKDDAEHRAYSTIGSRHKANRRAINIISIGEIDPRTSTEPSVLHHFRDQIAAEGGTIAPVAEEE